MGQGRENARTAGRALDVMLLLADRGSNGLTTRQLSDLMHAPRSSVADLLRVLRARRLVAPTAQGAWRLDFGVLQLGNAYLSEFSVREVGRPLMRDLANRTGLTCQMAVLEQSDVVYIERQDTASRGQIRLVTEIGSRLPAHCTALGKAMLARLSDEEIDRLYGSLGPWPQRTKNTVTSLPRLKSELSLVRRRHFAVDLEEAAEGIVCVGAAIMGVDGRPEAAISLAGVRGTLSIGALEALGPLTEETASRISAARGGGVTTIRVSGRQPGR